MRYVRYATCRRAALVARAALDVACLLPQLAWCACACSASRSACANRIVTTGLRACARPVRAQSRAHHPARCSCASAYRPRACSRETRQQLRSHVRIDAFRALCAYPSADALTAPRARAPQLRQRARVACRSRAARLVSVVLRRLARRAAGGLVRRPALHLVLLAAVDDAQARGAAFEVRGVYLLRAAGVQRTKVQATRGRSRRRSGICARLVCKNDARGL
jgi:hypothetical protein